MARARADCGFPWPRSRCTSRTWLIQSVTNAADGTDRSSNGSMRSRLCFQFFTVTSPSVCGGKRDRSQARRPGAGAVPGRWGARLAVRTPPAALLQSRSVVVQDRAVAALLGEQGVAAVAEQV